MKTTTPSFYDWMQSNNPDLFDAFVDDTVIVILEGEGFEVNEELDHHWLWQRRAPMTVELNSSSPNDVLLCKEIDNYYNMSQRMYSCGYCGSTLGFSDGPGWPACISCGGV